MTSAVTELPRVGERVAVRVGGRGGELDRLARSDVTRGGARRRRDHRVALAHVGGTLGPSIVNQSNVGMTSVAAAFESASTPTWAFAGIAVDVRPACVHVCPSVEYCPVSVVPFQTIRR